MGHLVGPALGVGDEGGLDAFCEAMLAIAREAADEPEVLKEAPHIGW